jgi:hypothetical protein
VLDKIKGRRLMQQVEDVEGHSNISLTKEVDGVEEENIKPDEATDELMVYMQ